MSQVLTVFSAAVITATITAIVTSAPSSAAAPFNAGYIISDGIMTNKDSMSLATVSTFINAKNANCTDYLAPCLRNYTENGKSAAQIIYDAAQAYNINPQVLLVVLQKETWLVTDPKPEPWQYRTAMGYGCPDTAPCNTQYYGFTNQVNKAAYMFHAIITQNPGWGTPYVPGPNYVQYNPNESCGGSTILIANWATAALYNYTPYQPNAAALAAGYGSAEPCGAYGNRNFWLYFNDWFGSPTNKDFSIVKSPNSPQQYVVYNNLKQYIPSPYIKEAWGIDFLPIETVDQSYIDSLVNGPSLDIVYRSNGGSQLYMVDNGKSYYIPSVEMMKTWGLTNKAISNVPTGLSLTPAGSGSLSYILHAIGGNTLYMMDGVSANNTTILRRYASPEVISAIEGPSYTITSVSNELFSALSSDIRTDITSTKAAYGGSEYQLISGSRRSTTYQIAQLYPGVATQVSPITFNRFSQGNVMTPFIYNPETGMVHLVQNGLKYHVTTPQLLNEWTGGKQEVVTVNPGFASLVPSSQTPLLSTITKTGSSAYIISGGTKSQIPPQLFAAYTSQNSRAFPVSQALLDTLANGNKIITRVITNRATGEYFVLDDSSILHGVPSMNIVTAWSRGSGGVTTATGDTLAGFSIGSVAQSVVSDGSKTYAIVDGVLRSTSEFSSQWRLPQPMVLTDSTLATLPKGLPLQPVMRTGNLFYRMFDGVPYVTTDQKIAVMWGIPGEAEDYSEFLDTYYPSRGMLTPVTEFDGSFYMADQDKLILMNQSMYANMKTVYPVMSVDPRSTGMSIYNWTQPVFRNQQGGWYVMDGGSLRTFTHPVILAHWTSSIMRPELVATPLFISQFPVSLPIERAVIDKRDGKIYSAENATKRWITSWNTYTTQYAPYTLVSDTLVNTLPSGPNL